MSCIYPDKPIVFTSPNIFNIACFSQGGRTVLMRAAIKGNLDVVALLIERVVKTEMADHVIRLK